MSVATKQFLQQLEAILDKFKELKAQSSHGDLSNLTSGQFIELRTRAQAAIDRISGRDSVYSQQVNAIIRETNKEKFELSQIISVAQALYIDLQAGYLTSVSELIHGEVFGDFLEMADHLHNEGYKDAAAVITGSTLEGHLRQLCAKYSVNTEVKTSSGDLRPKRADQMNSDLAGASAYSKLDQKNVTAWLDLRNKAAHGHYSDYTRDQVAFLIAGVRDFITRNPA